MRNILKKQNKIMLIDDNPGDGILLKEALKIVESDILFEAFQSGEKAIDELTKRYETKEKDESFLPDLILLDINMPEMDGFEVLEVLKTHEFLKYIPVVMMTTSSLPSDIEKSYKYCANSVVVKPMDFDSYITIIKTMIEYWFNTTKTVEYEY